VTSRNRCIAVGRLRWRSVSGRKRSAGPVVCSATCLATQRPNALSPPSGESGGRQTAIVGRPLSQSGQPLLGNGLPLSSDGSQSAAGSPLYLTGAPFHGACSSSFLLFFSVSFLPGPWLFCLEHTSPLMSFTQITIRVKFPFEFHGEKIVQDLSFDGSHRPSRRFFN
jgi:hypothetical protein